MRYDDPYQPPGPGDDGGECGPASQQYPGWPGQRGQSGHPSQSGDEPATGPAPYSAYGPPPYPGREQAPSGRNVPGRIALVLGLVLVVSEVGVRGVRYLATPPRVDAAWTFDVAPGFVWFRAVLCLIAVAFGVVGLKRRSRPHGTALFGMMFGLGALTFILGRVLVYWFRYIPF